MPSTPPETPLDAYFDRKQQAVPHSTHISIYPDSPPVTPTRVSTEVPVQNTKEAEKRNEKEKSVLPTHGPRRSSVAYAHHRRTSTATIIRLAAARQGIVLTPSKVLTLFLIVFSATYLASFLPGPLASLFHHRTSRAINKSGAPAYYSPPTVSGVRNNKPQQRTMPIGETAQRRAWEDSFPHRIPPQQHVVPVRHDSGHIARSHDGDLYRAHPELLISNTGSQPRRRPLRFGKAAATVPEEDKTKQAGVVDRRDGSNVDSSFDDAGHSPRRPVVPAERQAQINRMKKMSAAKQADAKVGSSAPLDSSEAAPAVVDRVHVEGGKSSRRKVKKVNSGGAETQEKEVVKREGAQPRLGMKDRQVVEAETHKVGKTRTVDEWAELEDVKTE